MPIRKALSALAVVSIVFVSLAGLTLVFAQAPPPPEPRGPQEQPRLPFGDVFGRFRVSLPSGAAPIGATYNFAIPASKAQVGITAMTQDRMFQTTMQNFPNMMQEMGGRI
jgi:hypothetical protein